MAYDGYADAPGTSYPSRGLFSSPQTSPGLFNDRNMYIPPQGQAVLSGQTPRQGIVPTQQAPAPTSLPPLPGDINYFGAAGNQGLENFYAGLDTTRISNPNVYTPFGNQQVTFENGVPSITQTLSPTEQAKLNQFNQLQPSLFGQINQSIQTPFSTEGFTDVLDPTAQGQSAVVDALRQREQPRFDRARQSAQTDLLTRGFNPGTEGFDNYMDEVNRAENDFNLGLIGLGGQEQSRLFGMQSADRARQMGEALTERQLPTQQYSQLASALSPSMTQFQPYQGANVEAAPYYQSAVDQGLFGLQRGSISGQINANDRATSAQIGGRNDSFFDNILGGLFSIF